MEDNTRGGKQDQLDDHSLPGTNQAGKGPGPCEQNDQENRAGGATRHPDQRTKEVTMQMKRGEQYACKKCGCDVTVAAAPTVAGKGGQGSLVCCGEKMSAKP